MVEIFPIEQRQQYYYIITLLSCYKTKSVLIPWMKEDKSALLKIEM